MLARPCYACDVVATHQSIDTVTLRLLPLRWVERYPMGQHKRPTFAALLKSFRAAAGLSQEELSERSGVTVSAISMLERGVRRSPFQHTVARLAAGLDLTPQEYALFEEAARSGRSGKQVAEASAAPTGAATVQPISHVQARMRATPDLVGRDHELEWLRGELAVGRPLLL